MRVGASSAARVIVIEGRVVRPSQLIASVRRTAGGMSQTTFGRGVNDPRA
jgi:hypothetical protein